MSRALRRAIQRHAASQRRATATSTATPPRPGWSVELRVPGATVALGIPDTHNDAPREFAARLFARVIVLLATDGARRGLFGESAISRSMTEAPPGAVQWTRTPVGLGARVGEVYATLEGDRDLWGGLLAALAYALSDGSAVPHTGPEGGAYVALPSAAPGRRGTA